ncbi:MAG TPA: ATP-binding protein [Planctomycetaceae bacterium]|nr:ATP-binding protein [Planctomycetaceae bacterium]
MTPIVFCWSGGKDSALALDALQRGGEYKVVSLLTTVTSDYDRISMHGVRRALLHAQARAVGLPAQEVLIPKEASNEIYEAQMGAALAEWRERGIEVMAFGDIFLEDLRAYRERNLAQLGMRALFPIWKIPTNELVQDFIDRRFRAVTVCIDTRHLTDVWVGRNIDADFVRDLPAAVDPCGENGEFHSFVYDAPNFSGPIAFELGERVWRDSFLFQDLIPRGLNEPEAGADSNGSGRPLAFKGDFSR